MVIDKNDEINHIMNMPESRNSKTVLAIFSHSDDELGCSGTLANHADAGDDVTLVFLSKGENSTTVAGGKEETIIKRMQHTEKISELLGVNIRFMDFQDSRIEYSVDNAYRIAEIIKEIKPQIIITWNTFNRVGAGHPDHRNCAKLVYDAINYARYQNPESQYKPYREQISLYRYFNPNLSNSNATVYIDVTDQIDRIKKFIQIYKEAYGDWPVSDYKFGSMQYYGRFAQVEYAEVFEIEMNNQNASKFLT